MESDGVTPLFNPGYEIGTFLVSTGLLSNAWEASCTAYRSNQPFILKSNENDESTVFIAFPGCPDYEIFQVGGQFGECKINTENDFFGSMKDVSDDQPALVHQGALKLFIHVWKNSTVQDEVLTAQKQGKAIVFTGHSMGGAIATFGTLCMMEKQRRNKPPFCVTFGCPLIGDEKFGQAIRRERWVSQFCHVVSGHDIFPRLLLAPLESISGPLQALLPYWWKAMAVNDSGSTHHSIEEEGPLSEQQIDDFITTVLQHASTVVNCTKAACVTATTVLEGNTQSEVKSSPYRPSGYYVFCSRSGAVCIENHEAVLQILYYTLGNPDASINLATKGCISEHTEYGSILAEVIQNRVSLEGVVAKLVISEVTSPYKVGTDIQLEALGIGIQNARARIALEASGEVEKQLSTNNYRAVIALSKAQRAMAEIEWYKKCRIDDGIGYYDSFKLKEQRRDFRANINRIRLAGFWDKIIQMVEKHKLPDDLPSRMKWVYAGTAYRLLMEPLDIGHYYRLGNGHGSGHYLSQGRPLRYKILQKWFEDKMAMDGQERKCRTKPASLTQDSCFWARLEEISRSMSNPDEDPTEAKAKLEGFQNHVNHMIGCHALSPEIFLDKCSFIKWWKMQLTAEDRSASPLFDFMEGEGWKQYCGLPNKLSPQGKPSPWNA